MSSKHRIALIQIRKFSPPIMPSTSDHVSDLRSFLEDINTDEIIPQPESILQIIESNLSVLFFIIKRAKQGEPFPTWYAHGEVERSLQKDLDTLQRHFSILEEMRCNVIEMKDRYFAESEESL